VVFADALTKATRLVELQLAFWSNPGMVLTTSVLAARVGVAPRTMRKYITELSATGRLPVYRQGRGWRLAENARLEIPPVRFHLEEAAALYLAARLLLRHADEPNPAVRGALTKLARVVPEELRLPFNHLVQRSALERGDHFSEVFNALAYGWALKRVVRLCYDARSRDRVFEAELRPFLLEPAAVGSALYVIGRLDPPGALRVLKVERVREARLTPAVFSPPALDELFDRLDRAWGVWLSDEQPVQVALRFDAAVADRIRETRWHPSQRLAGRPDGGVDMTLTVVSTVEVLPWILGWGAHCEVLTPRSLRDQVGGELQRAAARYGEGPRS
jgi:predicted DNA-binding transcriptional regulator YafY